MEVLGSYWLRRALARMPGLAVYEGQDTRTGMPVMVLKGAKGAPLEGEGLLPLLEQTPEAWVLEWPLGAVPLSHYLGVADPDRLQHWTQELAAALLALRERGVRYAPKAELCLVKGRRLWLAGAGLEALEGEAEGALAALVRALAGEAWEGFPLREALEALEAGQASLESLLVRPPAPSPPPQEGPVPEPPPRGLEVLPEASPSPGEERKALAVEPVPERGAPGEPPLQASPSRPRVIRIEEREEPPFSVVEPRRATTGRRALLLALLGGLLLVAASLLLWPSPQPPQGYVMEFRTDPPTEQAEVILLEVPEGSAMTPGQLLLTAPGRVEFDRQGVYRLRIRVAGREPVDYLLEVPGPPLTIRVR